jgi:uncharacterized protein (TIGR00369 family)
MPSPTHSTPDAQETLHFGRRIPFLGTLGLQAGEMTPKEVTVRLPFRADLTNSAGALHGGALMAALDFAMSAAARSHDAAGVQVATIDMRTSFLKPAGEDASIVAVCIQRGRSLAFCEARATNAAGELVATATGTFKLTSSS